MGISTKSIETIASTVSILQIHGRTITTVMYKNLFMRYPELLNMYNRSNHAQGLQQMAFSNMLLTIAKHIDQIDQFIPSIKKINHKHVSVGVKPEHYPLVKECLLDAMKEVLGRGTATDRFVEAWEEIYEMIANIFIQLEAEMYQKVREQSGGWSGFKKFTIIDKVKESDVITSFYLQPEDQSALPHYEPGQYITIQMQIPDEPYFFHRQYCISCAPGRNYFRITVKNENDFEPSGVVSSYLHEKKAIGDNLYISVPRGTFFRGTEDSKAIALISGGKGITPMMSILDTLVLKQSKQKIVFIHAARNEASHAFARESAEMLTKLQNAHYYYGYEKPQQLLGHHDFSGYINEKLIKKIMDKEMDYYICGPYPFMKNIISILNKLGVDNTNIYYDFFAPELPVQTTTQMVR